MQWIYTEYFNVYSQYLSYFTTVIILLTSASAISLIKTIDKNGICLSTIIIFISFILAIFDIYLVFDIYDGIRTIILLMSSTCNITNGDIACDMNPQEQSTYLKLAIVIAIISFLFLVLGYILKIWRKHEN